MELCVALDRENFDENLALVSELKGLDVWFKIGLRSYLRDGFRIVEAVKKSGAFKIFLDLKIYDIPKTMADACEVCARLGVEMINLHASSGKRAMETVMDRLNGHKNRPLVLGVSALTSFSDDEFSKIYSANLNDCVKNMSVLSYESGLDGMVCSVFESMLIKRSTSENFLTLTPGIRPFGEACGDQKRVADLGMAKREKSDFIVVGRPIYQSKCSRVVVEKILESIK